MANKLEEKTLCRVVLTTDPTPLYTAPPGQTIIIRYLRISNIAAANATFNLYIQAPGENMIEDYQAATPTMTLIAQRMYSEPCFMVLESGWKLVGVANASGRLVVIAWGASVE